MLAIARGTVVIQNGPQWWIVVLPALTSGLLGAALVAWWQGRLGMDRWRRDTRLRAFTDFLTAHHEFERALIEFYASRSHPPGPRTFEFASSLSERFNDVRSAASMIELVGPASPVGAANKCLESVQDSVTGAAAIRAALDKNDRTGHDATLNRLRDDRASFTLSATSALKGNMRAGRGVA
jgi:hypothetical protein